MWTDFNGICDMQQVVVGMTASQLPSPSVDSQQEGMKRPEKVLLQAITSNTKSIFAKNKNDVTASGSAGGFELPPGANIILPVSMYEEFYVIAGAANQKLQITFLGGV